MATALNNLAALYRSQGRYAEAEPLYRRSLKIAEAALGPDHPDVALSLNNLAGLYELQGRYADAEPLIRRSLKIKEAKLGPDHPDVAQSLNNLALLYESQGRYAEAEPLFRRSLTIREATLGPDHPDVAAALNNLAVLYESQGRYADAEPLIRRSLKIDEAKLGPDHPDVATDLNNLAALQVEQGQWTEAVCATDRARRTSLRHVVHVLPALSERDQLTFLKAKEVSGFHGALSLAVAHPDDHATAEQSAGWVLNGKGLTQQALAQRTLLARSAQDPAAAKIVGQLRDVRNTLAARTLAIPRPGQEEDRTRALARLAERERELSRELGQVTGRPTRDDPWIEPDRVRDGPARRCRPGRDRPVRCLRLPGQGPSRRHCSHRTMPPGCCRRRAGTRSASSTSGRPRRSTPPSPPPARRCGPTRRRCATGASPTSSGRPARRSRRWPGWSSRRCCRTSGRRGAGSSAPMPPCGWSPGRRCRSMDGNTPSRTTRSPTSSAAATWSRAAAGRRTARRW